MSELKVYHCNEWHNEYTEFYLKSEADKAITELQSELEAKDLELANVKEDAHNTDKTREKWLQLARKQAMAIRRLKRALYKACANWADLEVFDRTVGIDDPNVEANRWALMRNKCLKKAEECK